MAFCGGADPGSVEIDTVGLVRVMFGPRADSSISLGETGSATSVVVARAPVTAGVVLPDADVDDRLGIIPA